MEVDIGAAGSAFAATDILLSGSCAVGAVVVGVGFLDRSASGPRAAGSGALLKSLRNMRARSNSGCMQCS